MIMDNQQDETGYRWYILILGALTNALAVAIPAMCMPVLFKEISDELNLSLVEIGLIWGISALPGIFTILLGGAIGDRFGPKRVLILACALAGLTGALRGLATDFTTMAATMFLFGLVTPFIPMNVLKTCGIWFSRRQLGLASGVLSMGMAFGFLSGSMISATFLSPWLGGWQHVLYLYGSIAIVLSIPWYFSRSMPGAVDGRAVDRTSPMSLRQTILYIARIRNVWLLGLTILGVSGCIQGALGYLPLYLRGLGWAGASADGATAAFHTISMVFVLPIALGSDKLGSRKKVLMAAGFMIILGMGLLSIADGILVWIAVCIAGMVRDGFMAVFLTSVIETEGVGVVYAGTATGMVMVFGGIGNLISPALGNSLAGIDPGLPFVFWASMTGLGLIGLLAAAERKTVPALATD
jgi:MFS family permease